MSLPAFNVVRICDSLGRCALAGLLATATVAPAADVPASPGACPRLQLPPPVLTFEGRPDGQYRALVRVLRSREVELDTEAIARGVDACATRVASRTDRPDDGWAWLDAWSDGIPAPSRARGKPWRVAARHVAAIAGERDPADRAQAEALLWHLWVESTVDSLGSRFNGYTYADELSARRGHMQGRVFTVGFRVAFEDRERGPYVDEVFDPALAAAGVETGLRLLALDGVPHERMDYSALVRYWWSPDPFDFTVDLEDDAGASIRVRGSALPHRLETVSAARSGSVGYVRVHRFARETTLELRRALRALEGVEALALDLRGNGGGAADLAPIDMFFKAGVPVAAWRELSVPDAEVRTARASVEYHPQRLAVLIDADSASMSEMLAAAVRAHERGVLVGETTFGKGVSQSVLPVGTDGELYLVETLYLFPGTERTWHEVGIAPDLPVELDDAARAAVAELLDGPVQDLERRLDIDPVLETAIRRLTSDAPVTSDPSASSDPSAAAGPPAPQETDR